MARYLDANIFLRFLRRDHPSWSPACRELFAAIEQGAVQAWTSDLVISEVVFVLSKFYKVSREDIATTLLPLLHLKSLRLTNKKIYRRLFQLYTTTTLSFVDSYNIALMESKGESEVYSYDQGYKAVPTIKRLEP